MILDTLWKILVSKKQFGFLPPSLTPPPPRFGKKPNFFTFFLNPSLNQILQNQLAMSIWSWLRKRQIKKSVELNNIQSRQSFENFGWKAVFYICNKYSHIGFVQKNLWLYFSKDIWMHFQNWLHWAMKVVGSNPHHWRQSWIHIPPALIFSIPAPPAYFQSISSSSVLLSHQYWTKECKHCVSFSKW